VILLIWLLSMCHIDVSLYICPFFTFIFAVLHALLGYDCTIMVVSSQHLYWSDWTTATQLSVCTNPLHHCNLHRTQWPDWLQSHGQRVPGSVSGTLEIQRNIGWAQALASFARNHWMAPRDHLTTPHNVCQSMIQVVKVCKYVCI